MSELFIAVVNMSVTASYVAMAVMVVRLLLLRAPKIFSYALWLVVLFRLVSPKSLESPLSLLPGGTDAIPEDIVYSTVPVIYTSMEIVDRTVNQSIQSVLPFVNSSSSVNPIGIVMEVVAVIWLLGIIGLLGYAIVSYLRLKQKLSTATLVQDNIYETDRIKTPFVLGFVNPRIFLPIGLTKNELNYILLHEQIHIKRKDYLIKPIAFLVVVLHWFNPLLWYCYYLMAKDMEMSCDESVMKQTNEDIRASYSNSLFFLSVKQNGLLSPLAFGESNVKSRIKNVLTYKKPAFWIIAIAVVVVVAVSIGLLTNPKDKEESLPMPEGFLKYKMEYVGDASRVVQIINALDYPHETTYDYIELGTDSRPYSVTIHLKADSEVNNKLLLQKNAIIMFSLISNVDYINYNINYGKIDYLLQYSRDWANVEMGRNVREFAEGEEEHAQLLEKLEYFRDGNNLAKIDIGVKEPISELVESNMRKILSSPKESTNPQDYINAHQNEYENILKVGVNALNYFLEEFEKGNNNNLRGHVMMRLSKDILGDRNNVVDDTLSPDDWYAKLSIYEETLVPNYVYDGDDPIEKLVYATEIAKNTNPYRGGFTVVAPKVHAYYEEGKKLKVFVTTYAANYHLYNKVVSQDGAGVVPAAITYTKDDKGSYILEEYEQAMDGSDFVKSIENYATMPVTGKKIRGLANKIVAHYGNYNDIKTLHRENLINLLKENNLSGIKLKTPAGEMTPLT